MHACKQADLPSIDASSVRTVQHKRADGVRALLAHTHTKCLHARLDCRASQPRPATTHLVLVFIFKAWRCCVWGKCYRHGDPCALQLREGAHTKGGFYVSKRVEQAATWPAVQLFVTPCSMRASAPTMTASPNPPRSVGSLPGPSEQTCWGHRSSNPQNLHRRHKIPASP